MNDDRSTVLTGPLVDRFHRVHTDLRISVTDRCNIRCKYCMPAEGVAFRPHASILSFEEIARFARVAAMLGIRKLRVTGGEPLVRKGIDCLVGMLARIPGIEDLALTTNGIRLPACAEALRNAGLRRLNISLDTLDPNRFRQITRRDQLDQVLAGIDAAQKVGFAHIKLNAVAIRGFSEADVVPLAEFARRRGLELRFIEFMPIDGERAWQDGQVLAEAEVLRLLADAFGPVEPLQPDKCTGAATRYRFVSGDGPLIGIIPSVTRPFCNTCGRLRLTSEGSVQNCLFSDESFDARSVMRSGGSDEDLAYLIRQSVLGKKNQHGTDAGEFADSPLAMNQIGG